MNENRNFIIDSPIGKQKADTEGSPVGVVRLDAEKSYVGVGKLLQDFINNSNSESWNQIRAKIDYTFYNLDLALGPLGKETNLSQDIKKRLEEGQKLLFKPNLVGVQNIDPQTHGPGPLSTTCTEWSFVAALMRWFHDKLNISYHQMALGEAATLMPAMASIYSMTNPEKKPVTVEATLEGKSGDFYGGWGFYFVRKYLAESLGADANDDPMNGYQESVSGTFIPPGHVLDKLMVYDLNRIFDEPTKGREVPVPGGVNYKSITLHKAIVGGNSEDPKDREAYPGCILVNVPKFKVHAITLFTNVIKNLGIGLYPMQHAKRGLNKWDYSIPHTNLPGMKAGIPHEVWVPEMDIKTGLPIKDADGNYVVNKTGGITATMIDIIKAVSNLDILMIHIVDGIEAVNYDHTGSGLGEKAPEGLVFAGIDPLATDLLCARYMFSNVPIGEALQTGLDDGTGGYFPHNVPVPKVEDQNIVTEMGYDCPLSRDICFKKAEERGLGQRKYYVVGRDAVTNSAMCSLQGHLGSINNGKFSDLITKTVFYDIYKFPWDMQKTAFSYMEAADKLEGLSLKKDFIEAVGENGNGIVTYEDFGKKGVWGCFLHSGGEMVSKMASERLGYLKFGFSRAASLKNSDSSMNPEGHDVYKDIFLGAAIVTAYQMSQMEIEGPDPFLPGLTWGKGKWPSFSLARFVQMGMALYGGDFPYKIAFPSLYSAAFFYADHTQNQGRYAGEIRTKPDPEALDRYISNVLSGQEELLDFTFYVPAGYDNLSGNKIPNVVVTSDPAKILTASFEGGKEIWPETHT